MRWASLRRSAALATSALGLALAAAALAPPGSAAAADPYEWAALGDSYTAGDFVGGPRPPLGDPARDGCDRTSGAYPGLVERRLAALPPGRSVRLTDVSCGDAAIAHVSRTSQTPVSPVRPPAGGWPAVAPQIERAGLDEGTDVVTIGIGGNSLPFGGMLLECLVRGASGTNCRDHYTDPPEGVEGIRDRLARIEDEYAGMLADVHEAAPRAEVIAVGYPAVLPRDAGDCGTLDLTELGPITRGDVDWLRDEVLVPLNDAIRRAASAFGDRYVDVHSSSAGRDACQAAGTKWIEGLCGDAADHWPAGVPGTPLSCAVIGKRATVVHPNAAGHAHTADHVERAVRAALTRR